MVLVWGETGLPGKNQSGEYKSLKCLCQKLHPGPQNALVAKFVLDFGPDC